MLALDASESDDLDLPDRCRVVKLANSVTYDRYVLSVIFLSADVY